MKIEGVATLIDGVVYKLPPPYRHYHLARLLIYHGIDPLEMQPDRQGFYVLGGAFVNREIGGQIALIAGQTDALKWGKELYSEDLW